MQKLNHPTEAPMRQSPNVLTFHPRKEQAKSDLPELYMVFLDHNKQPNINGFLSLPTLGGGKILLYDKEEAIFKAAKFKGEPRLFTFKYDKEKYIIV